MTSNGYGTAAQASSAVDIEKVDAFARQLFRRARNAGTDFSDVSMIVYGLHTVLKHLKAEAEDPDSLLNSGDKSRYIRQLTPILEDCEFTLQQLGTILGRCGGTGSGSEGDGRNVSSLNGFERDKIALIRTKLANQRLNIDMFLDTVQLHNPARSHPAVDTSNANLDTIKDKVDVIAARIFQRHSSNASAGVADDDLWRQFRDELEHEGFSKDVLRRNQDVLRAYIRQLDEQRTISGGVTPTVRGFLESYESQKPSFAVAPYPPYPADPEELSPKEMYPSIENEKFFPSIKDERRQSEKQPPYPSSLAQQSTNLSYDRRYSGDDDMDDGHIDDSMALVISTRDLMAIDKREADLAIAMDNMHLQPAQNYITGTSPGTSPQNHYLPAPPNAGLLPSADQSGLSPHFASPPPYAGSPPPVLHAHSMSAPVIPGITPSLPGQSKRCSRLAPDSQGHDIPLDASWTRIRRSLVSPEVLHQAGVRFEARPDFVAILGVFTKEDIGEFARRSAEVRRRRMGQRKPRERSDTQRYYPDKYKNWDVEAQKRNVNGNNNGADNRRRTDSQSSSGYDLFDSSSDSSDEELPAYRSRDRRASHSQDSKSDPSHEDADEKGTKSYPFIVPPPDKDKGTGASPSATVTPKPILKNKNDDPHVRFDPEPKVLNDGSTPKSVPQSRSSGHRDRDERERRYREDRYAPRSYDDRDHRRDAPARERDRGDRRDERGHRGSEDDYNRRHGHSRQHSDTSSRPRSDRYSARRRGDRDRYRDDGDRNDDRMARKKARGETLRAVGIGGAAASLLSVLTEAAAGL
ncbi:hypothetical protein PG993_013122 [Apiospora rasikravindrae]|uniref:DUF8035 domain-containing protein n=1 Tax=Apiospora rasikravindrae TaxID=990691 RepID=A0ABR1RY29_9PEZI